MRRFAITALFGGTLAMVACGGATGDTTRLEARIAALERRAPSATIPPGDEATATPATVERLDADLRSLEQRLADVEAAVAMLQDAGLDGAAGGAMDAESRRERRSDRRDRMRALTATYRDKLADVRQRYRDDPDPSGRQRALRDVVDWYRTERRAIIRGD